MDALRRDRLRAPALYRPRNLQEAWELKRTLGDGAVYVSGSTLLRTQWEAGTVSMPEALIDLRGLEGLSGIEEDGEAIRIGAMTDLSSVRRNSLLDRAAPSLKEAARVIAAPAVRNLATLGGNIASGYGDTLPALLAANAELEVYDGAFASRLRTEDWLASRWGGPYSSASIIAGVRISPAEGPEGSRRFEAFRKVGRREAFTPSLVAVALSGFVGGDGRLSGVRIAAGGGSGRPHRLAKAETLLEGGVLTAELLPQVYEAVTGGFETSADPFATAEYKRKTAGNLIAAELWKLI
ncbi:FAD binding domain-containing protein [Paenibacillus sp. HN-1]|uniref:FAD binding domain-containing protein n=1 Tax=Paenibacillus TaxID=44249 RepID=UPI001CA98E91|nr:MULTISPECIES: FAD binding domain-containing protein [Paenibacillus]MBY9080821.1 FAD binding domain-containing protein [Paenibacillus sp. CGMCC 1.18879]MBY9085187.1 FAD binding domain-containing protein [Paenibacillus sinensis]